MAMTLYTGAESNARRGKQDEAVREQAGDLSVGLRATYQLLDEVKRMLQRPR